jgi:hypothetical protein
MCIQNRDANLHDYNIVFKVATSPVVMNTGVGLGVADDDDVSTADGCWCIVCKIDEWICCKLCLTRRAVELVLSKLFVRVCDDGFILTTVAVVVVLESVSICGNYGLLLVDIFDCIW